MAATTATESVALILGEPMWLVNSFLWPVERRSAISRGHPEPPSTERSGMASALEWAQVTYSPSPPVRLCLRKAWLLAGYGLHIYPLMQA
jgi:hypothetical protein